MIYISEKARQKLYVAANLIPNDEISGFGRTELVDGGVLVTDIVIPPQEVGGAHVEIKNMWQNFFTDCINGKWNDGKHDDPLNWRLWWHKHPGGGKPGPSGTDTDSLKWLAGDCGFGWMAGVIISARAENIYGWVDMAPPNVPIYCSLKDVAVTFLPENIPQTLKDEVEAEMAHVKKRTYGGSNTGGDKGHWHRDVDNKCYCDNNALNHRPNPNNPHRHGNRQTTCYCKWHQSHDVKLLKSGEEGQAPLPFRSGHQTEKSSKSTGASDSDGRSGLDFARVKNITKVSAGEFMGMPLQTGYLEITFKNGDVMMVPDHGEMEDWIDWLESPPKPPTVIRPQSGPPPPPQKKPGERPPKGVKKQIAYNIKHYDIRPLLNAFNTEEVLEWSPGIENEGDEPLKYPIGVDKSNFIVLGFDDEGDPVHDLYHGDEAWVYYDLNGRAVDRTLLEQAMDIADYPDDSPALIAYLRGKYLIDPAVGDALVKAAVDDIFNIVDVDEQVEGDGTMGGAIVNNEGVPLTEDESA